VSIDDELGSGPDFRLAALMSIHLREHHELQLPDTLGDGALLNRLPPLAHMRRALKDFGYIFMPASQIAGIHAMFPILELTEIFRTRTIPFRRTALAAEQVLADRPDLSMPDSLFRDICVASYSFHEGAHAIFYETACVQEGIPHGRRLVEVVLGSEAFAMAFEQYVALLAMVEGQRSTSLFLALNAYANPLDNQRLDHGFPGAVGRLGRLALEAPAQMLTMLLNAHLVALLRPTAVAGLPGLSEQLAAYAGLPSMDPADAEHLTSIGFHVDYEFRGHTQNNFYSCLGLEHELEAVRAEPLESYLAGGTLIEEILPPAIDAVLGCTASLP
jgi:hypothetical protein